MAETAETAESEKSDETTESVGVRERRNVNICRTISSTTSSFGTPS